MMCHRTSFLLRCVVITVLAVPLAAQRTGGGRTGGSRAVGPPPPMGSEIADPNVPVTRSHVEDEGLVTFSTSSQLVLVPVVVTGKDGAPVLHLKKEDFEVMENGKPQTVATFEEYATAPKPLHRAAPKNEFTNQLDDNDPRRISIIMLDALNTPFLDQTYARGELIKYLSKSLDDQRVTALVVLDQQGLRMIHDFTSDSATLVAALKKVSGSLPAMKGTDTETLTTGAPNTNDPTLNQLASAVPDNQTVDLLMGFIQQGAEASAAQYQQEAAAATTLAALSYLANEYAGITGKKSLVWVTGGFPFIIDDPSTLPSPTLGPVYEATMKRLTDANIAVYPVDARGLVTNNIIQVRSANGLGTSFRPVARGLRLNGASIDPEGMYEQEVRQTFDEIAQMTGGRVFASRNDLTTGFAQVDKDSSSYYVLGYYLDQKNSHAGWRKLKVKTKVPDVKLLYRGGFFVANATVNPASTKAMEVMNALHSPIFATGLMIRAKWLATAADGAKRDVQYLMGVNPGSLVPDDKGQIDIDLVGIVFDKDGKQIGLPFGRNFAATLTPEQSKVLASYGLVDKGIVALDPGTYNVHFAVRDNKTGRIGTIIAPLTVP